MTPVGLMKAPLLSAVLLLGGCGFFGMEHTCYPDYGLEAGYYLFESSLDTNATELVEVPLWRDRNQLEIRFYNGVGRERAVEIMQEHGFIIRFNQSFDNPLKAGNFVRVTQHPAEHYYTTYGDTTLPRLGNAAEVEYALPAFYAGVVEGTPHRVVELISTNPSLSVYFEWDIPEEMQQAWIDSVNQVNRLEKYQLYEGSDPSPPIYYLEVTKKSTDDPYTLANKWLADPLIRETSFGKGSFPYGLPELECP